MIAETIAVPYISDAFRSEYTPQKTQGLRRDTESYLAEYRFGVEKFDYQLDFKADADGVLRLIDPDTQESMYTKGLRGIVAKRERNQNSSREEADLIGIASLDHQIAKAFVGDIAVWMSPPGSKEEGYGDYGFLYIGVVEGDTKPERISFSALRIEGQTVDQCNDFLATLLNQDVHFTKPEELVANPVVANFDPLSLQFALRHSFDFSTAMAKKKVFDTVLPHLENEMETFMQLVDNGASKHEVKVAFEKMERKAVALRDTLITNRTVNVNETGDSVRLQSVGGSCGSSGGSGISETNIFNKNSLTTNALAENEKCGVCGGSAEDNHYHCPNTKCEKKYADETHRAPKDRTKECGCGFKFNC